VPRGGQQKTPCAKPSLHAELDPLYRNHNIARMAYQSRMRSILRFPFCMILLYIP
jgi:hypothetical protein